MYWALLKSIKGTLEEVENTPWMVLKSISKHLANLPSESMTGMFVRSMKNLEKTHTDTGFNCIVC